MKLLRIDPKSIHFKLLIYFTLFACLIIAMIGGMEVLLFNNFYGTMKERDTINLANTIRSDFIKQKDDEDFSITEFVETHASSNDVSILIMQKNGSYLSAVTGSSVATSMYGIVSPGHNTALWKIYEDLASSRYSDSPTGIRRAAKMTTKNDTAGGRSMLAYACYLEDPVTEDYASPYADAQGEANGDGQGNEWSFGYQTEPYIMFVLAPLYPTTSTIRILLNIMVTIFAFAIVLVLIIALYLSQRISKPIKDITLAAEKLGKGDYNVKFDGGGHYSEITELADTLSVAEHEMEKTEMYQKDLIANVSHDIRTPLTMIKSYAEMIHDISGDDPEKRNEHLKIIIDETDRLNKLVNDMLDLSRMQSNKIKLERTVFDISLTAKDVLTAYDILEEQEGYHIDFRCLGSFKVNADEGKISQVMNNLMTNAVKYCGSDKEIYVTLKRVKRSVMFEVTDHGQGISQDELPHVWDKYYKSSTHHVRETTGTGLGLSIVREILKLHGAEYGVKSEVGKGSTFWFSLPIYK
jgi:signal transduction histidine kinase